MTNFPQPNESRSYNIPNSTQKEHQTKYELSNMAVPLLMFLSEKSPFKNMENLSNEFFELESPGDDLNKLCDDALGELIHFQLVKIDQLGKLVVTENGMRAVDKKVAIAYPLGTNGTITNYVDTLNTQTGNAANALAYSISNTDWLSKISPRAKTAILRSVHSKKVYEKVDPSVTVPFTCDLVKHMSFETSKQMNLMQTSNICNSIYEDTRNMIMSKIVSYMTSVEKVSLKNPFNISVSEQITDLSFEEGIVYCTIKDVYSLDTRTCNFESLSLDSMLQVASNVQ